MAVKKYGKFKFDDDKNQFVIEHCEPHVSIKLKKLFPKIPAYQVYPYAFSNNPENATDLAWFMVRYPMEISAKDKKVLERAERIYKHKINLTEQFHLPGYKPAESSLKPGEKAREYQLTAKDIMTFVKRSLLADDLGLGKTLSATLTFLEPFALPGIVACQTHMPNQWKAQIERFTYLKVHIIKGTTPYDLPPADVYIIKYSCLAGWSDIFATYFFKTAIYDEIQELRGPTSQKHNAGKVLSEHVDNAHGLSATPIYNYGDEIFTILNLLKPECLGTRSEFLREWCTPIGSDKWRVNDPQALGVYLRNESLMIRRTRADVGRELPPINKIIIPIEHNEEEVEKVEELAKILSIKMTTGNFMQRGEAARELDIMIRYTTGMAKAKSVAAYVKILLEAGERLILAGWHRDVYSIWLKELEAYKPVMYTGSESTTQKEAPYKAFINKETNLFIISLRSGAGLDGLQHSCSTIVHGELDWSPKTHDQLNGRIDRDAQQFQVTALYPVTDWGSDPLMMNLLGLKSSQSYGIINPRQEPLEQHTDEGRLKQLAQYFLDKNK